MPTAFPRWLAVAVLLVVSGTLLVVRAQPANGTYGIELRGAGDGSRIEARVGPDTAQTETSRTATVVSKSPQPFTVKWSAGEVSVTIGGQAVRYPAAWKVGNAVRISAHGGVRASIAVLGGRRVDKRIAGTAAATGTSELVISGGYLTKSWTLDGAIDWPDEPTPADAVMVTTTIQDPPAVGEDPKNRLTFTSGIADPFVFSPPSGISRRQPKGPPPQPTLTWTGNAQAQDSRKWSVAANWDPEGVPQAGDILEFPKKGNQTATINDLPDDPALGGIIVSGPSYELSGKGLKLAADSVSQILDEFRVDSLEGSGTIELGGGTVFTVGPRSGTPLKPSTTFSGNLEGGNGAELVKDGQGTLIFAGVANIELVTVDAGSFALADGARVGALSVQNGAGSFGGPPGTAYSGNFEIDNTDYLETIGPGGHGLLKVTGGVHISDQGTTTLRVNVAAGYVPPAGTPIIIIQNDGTDPVVDSPNNVFRDTDNRRLNEGDTFTANGVTFRISYQCNAEKVPAACDGTGNDIGFFPTSGAPVRPDLTIAKTHTGNFTQGQTGATYTITVTNSGNGPTTGVVTVTDVLPSGLTAATISGTGWGCTLSTLTCTRGDVLAPNASFPPLTLTVTVAGNAPPGVVTNTGTVSGGGETNTTNNTATDMTTIGAGADLTIDKAHTGNFTRGQTGTYTITVRNAGAVGTSGSITVTDALPAGLTATGLSGSGWNCTPGTLTCTRSDSIGAGASAPPLTLTVTVAANAPASVTNTATVSGGGDTNTTNNSDADPTTILGGPDLTIAKTHAGNFTQGQTGATYAIAVTNSGTAVTSGAIAVTDALPGGLTATALAGAGWTCTLSPLSCTHPGPIGAGASAPPLTLTVTVAANAPASVTNTATVSGGAETNTTNNTATDATTIGAGPDLTITKAHTGSFVQGQTGATYTIIVTNSGGAGTTGTLTVADSLPAGLTATALAGTGWTCTVAPLSCTRTEPIAAGASAPPLTLTVNVANNAPATVTNTATVSGGGETNATNNTATDVTTIGAGPDLTIRKTHAGSFTQGQTGATYTVTVINSGGAATTGTITAADALPAGLTATGLSGSGWNCTLGTLTCTRGDPIAPGASAPPLTLTVTVAANAPASVTNTTTVSGGGESNTTNNTATDVTTVGAGPDLTIAKTQAGGFTQGQTGATYTITVTNSGNSPTSSSVTVTDSLPDGLTATGLSGSGWNCTLGTLTCTHGDSIAAGASAPPLALTVNVAANAPASVTNTATISGGGDVNPANNTATDATTIGSGPDLTIAKTHTDHFSQGQTGATYTISVRNAGGAGTSGAITVTDALPSGLTATAFTGSGWTCTLSPLACTHGDAIAAGTGAPALTLTVDVAPDAPASLTNTATVSGGGDVNAGNNTAADPTTIGAGPDLTIAKTHAGNFTQGQTGATYTITVTNAGNTPTSGTVTVTDTLPAGLTATGLNGTAWSCTVAPLACTYGDPLAAGAVAPTLTLTVDVAPNAPASVTNTAAVSGGSDVNPANNTATNITTIGAGPDLTVTKTHPGNFTQGQIGATYTIAVTNSGNSPTSSPVTVTDTLPGGLTATGLSGSGWNCTLGTLTCTHGDSIAAGASAPPLTLTVNVAATAPASVTNTATISGGGDVNPANNTATDLTSITPVALVPDLRVTKSHAGDFFVGQQGATYTVSVTNAGTGPTSGDVTVEDPVPQGLTPVSGSGPGWTCAVEAQTVACHRSDALAPTQTYPALTITVNVGPVALTTTNIATVSGGGTQQPSPSPPDPTTIAGRPQLTIIKSHPDPVVQGERGLPFSLLVSNNGTGPTTGTVTVTDLLPAGLAVADAAGSGWNCGIAAATATCSRNDVLAQAQSYPVIQIRADVAADAASTVNEAAVSGGGDTTPDDNVARDSVPISPAGQPNLILTKEHDGDFTQGQQGAAYRLRVANVGQAPTVGLVTVTDNLPAGLTPTSASGSGWACTMVSQSVTCTRSDGLAPGASFPLIVLVVNVAANATNLVNVASLTGGGDQTAVDNISTDETHVVARAPDLSVAKRHADPFLAGQQSALYHITVTNTGTGPTVGEVVVVDPVPAGLTPVSASGSGWSCAVAARTVTCRRSDSLAPGASFPDITLLVNVEPNASNLTNVVSVNGGGDSTPDNNTDSDNTSINVSPDPTISLSRSTPLVVLQDAEYQVVVTNLGPGLLGGQTDVETVLPAELAPLSALGDGWSCRIDGQRLLCTRIGQCLPNNAFSTIRVRTLVRQGPTAITVTAKVANDADSNLDNNVAVNTSDSVLPASSVSIVQRTTTPRVEIGGVAAYEIDVTNTGESILLNAVVHDLLPRGFVLVKSSTALRSATRTRQTAPSDIGDGNIDWPIESLAPGETVTLLYQAIVGAGARSGPQDNRATVDATGPLNAKITAGPAVATVEVTTEVFTMLQALVGRVFEDVDDNGLFGGGDRPIANARVITSTGQAALTDPAGMYNIPSIGSGTVAVSLDRDTIPAGLTVDDGPGGRSWTRMLRTPIGGGTLLTQNFPLRRAAGAATTATIPTTPPDAADVNRVPDDPAAGNIPPRRDYETRQGSSLFIGLGEVSFGRAAQEFELFQKDKDAWATGSVFYQGTVGSPKNQLTFAADSRRRLNGTTDRDRLFELDPNDRMYPLFGDASRRQEFATANSKVFARLERGASHVMWGDLVGDLPSSATDGGRWTSYQRHLTGVEVRVADAKGDHVTLRGAQPETAYAREVFAGGQLGLITLGHIEVLQGTETVALEVRDRRLPDRLLERDVLARGVDYQLEPGSGTLFLQRNVSGLDPQLNLVQVVVTYQYQNQGLDHMVFNGRAAGTYRSIQGGMTFFTEEGVDNARFTVAGLDLVQSLPHGGRWRLDLPYSHGTPNVAASVDTRPVDAGSNTDGFAIQADVEQPVEFWSGVLRASFLHADDNFRNPFSATITPGAGYANASAELSPWTPTRIRFGGAYRALQHHERRRDPHDAVRRMGPDDGRPRDAQRRLRRPVARPERHRPQLRALYRAGPGHGRRSFPGEDRPRAERQGRHRSDLSEPNDARGALEDQAGHVAFLHATHLRLGDRPGRRLRDNRVFRAGDQGRAERRRRIPCAGQHAAHERVPRRARHQRAGCVRDDRRAHACEARPRAWHELRPRARPARQRSGRQLHKRIARCRLAALESLQSHHAVRGARSERIREPVHGRGRRPTLRRIHRTRAHSVDELGSDDRWRREGGPRRARASSVHE